MNDQEERVHDEDEWHTEAQAVINDVKDCVKEMLISSDLPASNSCIYCNLTTLENNTYCIELTAAGFRIVGKTYNNTQDPSEQFYETPYSLLDNISPKYRESFSCSLAAKLNALIEKQGQSQT